MTSQRTVLITGGTGSLGYQAAKAIAATHDGWVVVITGRDRAATTLAASDLSRGTNADVVGLPLDLSSLDDVRRFASDLTAHGLPPLHAIVCNAGVQIVSGTTVTADGIEATFGINHLAHFLLIQLLLPRIVAPGRIVLVASDTHDPTRPTGMPAPSYTDARSLAHPSATTGESATVVGRRRYTTSKLCNVLMAYELARRLSVGESGPPPITVNAFDPGLMPGTGLARDYTGMQAFAWRYLLPVLTLVPGVNAHTPRRSAAALAWLVTDPSVQHSTGRYFSGTREIRSSADSYDLAKAADLWRTSTVLSAR